MTGVLLDEGGVGIAARVYDRDARPVAGGVSPPTGATRWHDVLPPAPNGALLVMDPLPLHAEKQLRMVRCPGISIRTMQNGVQRENKLLRIGATTSQLRWSSHVSEYVQ